ncbi:hypothetical protein JYU34_016838 [Plutella xylostella]|uniref:Uncharacterized protein n=1 Tax=Plutella xylostella TaxID=51655 RepID=A0ABQ7Q3R6_PLUXY|nr:hypothetical protein JYU34_016838 [Plutella xylostella]
MEINSPHKKRAKLQNEDKKRSNENESSHSKRIKPDDAEIDEDSRRKKILAMKKKNFITTCKQVSSQAYFDHKARFQLVYTPSCMKGTACKHHLMPAKPIPGYAEESFKIEVKTNMWCEALEVCRLCITPHQYLTANVLKDVVEIILNAHEDPDMNYSVPSLIEECQQILSQNFSSHPPCLSKGIRKCYITFLTSPMELKENTFTNRTEFGCDKGLVKYCWNRLEYEVSSFSKDGPLLDRCENTPSEMVKSVKGLHWQKEKFEIYELLDRTERIGRLMAVLESVVELLQFDLAIWHSRYTNNQGRHIMRSHKPLLAFILWSDNVLYTGACNNNCRQILKLFVLFVHLGYPKCYVDLMLTWLKLIVQVFYICESNSNSDFPNTGKYCITFAREFYKIIADLPNESVTKVLEAIQPTFMTYLVGILHLKSILSTKEDEILKIMIDFVKKSAWTDLPDSDPKTKIGVINPVRAQPVRRKLRFLIKKIKKTVKSTPCNDDKMCFPKHEEGKGNCQHLNDQMHVVQTLYITLQAFLDAYCVEDFQEKLETLNDKVDQNENLSLDDGDLSNDSSYNVSEGFIKKYRSIYQMLQELAMLLHSLKSKNQMPDILKVFSNVPLLGL